MEDFSSIIGDLEVVDKECFSRIDEGTLVPLSVPDSYGRVREDDSLC